MSKNDCFALHKPLELRDKIINLHKIFALTFLLLAVSYGSSIQADQDREIKPSKAEIIQNTQKLQIPFIANKGQSDGRVMFYANSFGGTVFVTKDGEIIYSLSNLQNTGNYSPTCPECYSQNKLRNANMIRDTRYGLKEYQYAEQRAFCSSYQDCYNFPMWSENHSGNVPYMKGLALKEELLGGKIEGITGERETITKVNYFKGKDPSRWKTNISIYEAVNLGEVYKGICLKLNAYGNNIEKLFYVKPSVNPEIIKLKLSGVK